MQQTTEIKETIEVKPETNNEQKVEDKPIDVQKPVEKEPEETPKPIEKVEEKREEKKEPSVEKTEENEMTGKCCIRNVIIPIMNLNLDVKDLIEIELEDRQKLIEKVEDELRESRCW